MSYLVFVLQGYDFVDCPGIGICKVSTRHLRGASAVKHNALKVGGMLLEITAVSSNKHRNDMLPCCYDKTKFFAYKYNICRFCVNVRIVLHIPEKIQKTTCHAQRLTCDNALGAGK